MKSPDKESILPTLLSAFEHEFIARLSSMWFLRSFLIKGPHPLICRGIVYTLLIYASVFVTNKLEISKIQYYLIPIDKVMLLPNDYGVSSPIFVSNWRSIQMTSCILTGTSTGRQIGKSRLEPHHALRGPCSGCRTMAHSHSFLKPTPCFHGITKT